MPSLPRQLVVLLTCSAIIVTAIAGPLLSAGVAAATSQTTIETVSPAEVSESSTVTHEIRANVTGLSAVNGSRSNDTITISFPSNLSEIESYSLSVTDGTGSFVEVLGRSSNTSELSFQVNRSESSNIVVNASVTVKWSSVSAHRTGDLRVTTADSDGTIYEDTATLRIKNTKTSDTDTQHKADANLVSSGRWWRGHDLFFDASNVVSADYQFEIWSVTDEDELDTRIETFRVDADQNTSLVETGNLSGSRDFVIVYQDDVVVTNSDGMAMSLAPDSPDGIAKAKWSITDQSLSASFDTAYVTSLKNESTVLSVNSNRGTYTLRVSADGLNATELDSIFNTSRNPVKRIHWTKDFLEFGASDSTTIDANFTGIDPGAYHFELKVPDTTASTTASVNVTGTDEGIRFSQSSYTQEVGDIAELTFEFVKSNQGFVFVGGPSVNYLERIHLVDSNTDGKVTLELNTWAAGRSAINGNLPGGRSAEGIGYRVVGDDEFGDEGIRRYNSSDFTGDIAITTDLNDPLEPDLYPLRLSTTGRINTETGEVVNVVDRGVLGLQSRGISGMRTYMAPAGVQIGSIEEIRSVATRSESVAEGDIVIIEVGVSGIFGYVNETYPFAKDGSTVDTTGVYLTLPRLDPEPNSDRRPIQVGNATTVLDPKNDRVFFVVELAGNSAVEAGQQYLAEFVINESNPYIEDTGPGTQAQRIQQRISIVERSVTFEAVNTGGVLEIAAGEQAELSGTSTLAPGQELRIYVSAAGDRPARTLTRATVRGDGTFRTNLNVTELPVGTPLEITVNNRGTTIGQLEGIIGPEYAAKFVVNDQQFNGSSIRVRNVSLSRGGFVVLFAESRNGSILGTSDYLGSGLHKDVRIPIEGELGDNSTVIAAAYVDWDHDRAFDPGADRRYGVDRSFTVYRERSILSANESLSPTVTASTGSNGSTEGSPTVATSTPSTTVNPSNSTESTVSTTGSFSRMGAVVTGLAIVAVVVLTIRRQ